MPSSIMQKNYSHCPLKKRPVFIQADDQPQNLSTKPADLLSTGQLRVETTSSAALSPAHSPELEHKPLLPAYNGSVKLEPLNLKTAALDANNNAVPAGFSAWAAQAARLHAAIPTVPHGYVLPYADAYASLYASPYSQVSPARSEGSLSPPLTHYSPYARESSVSPPLVARRAPPSRFLPYQAQHSLHGQRASLSPTWSHSSFNSLLSGSRLSVSPAPEDLSRPEQPAQKEERAAPRYSCPDCAKSYSTFSGLSKHQQFHCPAAEGSQAKKAFSCKNCDKVYVSLGALKMHIRTHTLPCKCHLCGKAFSRPWLLQGHIRTHTGEKPFNCQHCQRAFADRSNLRAHLQTHSDVKKYSCAACSKTFSRMSLLTKHAEGGCCGSPAPASSGSPPPFPASLLAAAAAAQDISVY